MLGVVLSVIDDVSVDREASVVTSSISRICQPSLQDAHRGRVCVLAFIYGGECACAVSV